MMSFRLFLLLVVCFITLFNLSGASFLDGFADWIGGLVDDMAGKMIDHVKQAFEEAMHEVINNDVIPLVQMVQALLDKDIQEVDNDVKALVANVEDFMSKEIQEVAKLAQNLADRTIDEIKTKIINVFFQDLNEYTNSLFDDINTILNKIEQIEDKFICTEVSVIDEIINSIKDAFGLDWWVIDPFDPCREQVDKLFPDFNLRYKFFSEYTTNQLYYYTKCTYLNPLNQNSPIIEIRESYRDWETLAANMRCGAVAIDDHDDTIFYLREMGEASRRYHIWDNVVNSLPKATDLKNNNEKKSSFPDRTHSRRDNGKVLEKKKNVMGPNCTTPLQCFEEAYEMLIEAQQDIQKFKDLAVLANETSTTATKTSNQAMQNSNSALSLAKKSSPTNAIGGFFLKECPDGWIAADGSNGTPDLRGQFLRGLNNFGTGVRNDGKQDPQNRNLGEWQADALKSHNHPYQVGTAVKGHDYKTKGGEFWYGGYNMVTGNFGDVETRSKNVALIFCKRQD